MNAQVFERSSAGSCVARQSSPCARTCASTAGLSVVVGTGTGLEMGFGVTVGKGMEVDMEGKTEAEAEAEAGIGIEVEVGVGVVVAGGVGCGCGWSCENGRKGGGGMDGKAAEDDGAGANDVHGGRPIGTETEAEAEAKVGAGTGSDGSDGDGAEECGEGCAGADERGCEEAGAGGGGNMAGCWLAFFLGVAGTEENEGMVGGGGKLKLARWQVERRHE